MEISVSSYSFSQYIKKGALTQLTLIEKAKEMGFDAVEFTDIDGKGDLSLQKENAEKLMLEAERCGIKINAYTIGANLYTESAEEAEKEITRLCGQADIAKILGAPLMRHDVCRTLGSKGNARSFDLMLPTIAKNARRVASYAESIGVKTCSENHGFIAQDAERLERLFNAVAHDNYGILIDIGNFVCVDEDSKSAVSRLAPYAVHVHIKDMIVSEEPISGGFLTRGVNYFKGCVIGEGDVPVKKCLAILKRAGYGGCMSIEYEGTEDAIAGISRGLTNLKAMLKELDM